MSLPVTLFLPASFRVLLNALHMKELSNHLRMVAILFLALVTSNSYAAVGELSGKFEVTPTGAASYSIPIVTPPGVNGVQPQLSLEYSSRGGSSEIGIGWSIGGAGSAVTRCGASIDIDGFKGGVYFDDRDRYCLNGQRLVLYSGSSYETGTEFRTRNESWKKVEAVYGSVGGITGPTEFQVTDKSGNQYFYGNSSNSRILGQNGTNTYVYQWKLTRYVDVSGNAMEYVYHGSGTTTADVGDIASVYYVSDGAGGYLNRVDFLYENRPDVSGGYVAGIELQNNYRLLAMHTYADNAFVRKYIINYTNHKLLPGSQYVFSSLVSGVQVCDSINDCQPETNFQWVGEDPDRTLNYTEEPVKKFRAGGAKGQNDAWFPVDVDGDGMTDLVHVHSYLEQKIYTYISDGSGGYSDGPISDFFNGGVSTQFDRWLTLDANGDGLTDMVHVHSYPDKRLYVHLSDGQGGFIPGGETPFTNGGVSTEFDEWLALDTNGDGLTDLVHIHSYPEKNIYVHLSDGQGGFLPPQTSTFTTGNASGNYNLWMPLDANGDGLADLVQIDAYFKRDLYVFLSDGQGQFSNGKLSTFSAGGAKGQYDAWYTVDINGDGITDLAHVHSYGEQKIYSLISDGQGGLRKAGFSTFQNGGASGDFDQWLPLDINGDGLTDLAHIRHYPERKIYVHISNSNNGFTEESSSTFTSGGAGTAYDSWLPLDANGDGHADLVHLDAYFKRDMYVHMQSSKQNTLSSIISGYGYRTDITLSTVTGLPNNGQYPWYNTASTSGCSSVQANSADKMFTLSAPIYAVKSVTTPEGIVNYDYQNSIYHSHGGGWLGFGEVTIDHYSGLQTINRFSQDFEGGTNGLVCARSKTINTQLLAQEAFTYQKFIIDQGLVSERHMVKPVAETAATWDLDGSITGTVNKTSTYDAYGNKIQSYVETGDFHKTTTNVQYLNDETSWLIGLVTRTDNTKEAPGKIPQTRSATFTHDTLGRVVQEVTMPDVENNKYRVTKDYIYDGFGNIVSTTTTADGPAITSTKDYDPSGRFVLRTTNALGHTNQADNVTDPATGKLLAQTGPNGLTTTWQYDGFGREVNKIFADGKTITTSITACDADCPANGVYMVTKTTMAGSPLVPVAPPVKAYYDNKHRQIRTISVGFGDQDIFTDKYYDTWGRVDRVTSPYFRGAGQVYETVYSYDALSRVVSVASPGIAQPTTKSYSGMSTTVTNSLFQTKTTTKNQIGQTVTVMDNAGTLTYDYDSWGNVLSVTDPMGNVTSMTYDAMGRKIAMNDPDMGAWSYTYNKLGQLVSQQDAIGNVTSMTYDVLGRMLTRVNAEGTSTWTYDTAANGIGKLASVSGPAGDVTTPQYDGYGRPIRTDLAYGGTTYTTTTSFDNLGRPNVTTYPETGFQVKNVYQANGYLKQVQRVSDGKVLWQANAMDETGRMTVFELGNGLTTTRVFDPARGVINSIQTVSQGGAYAQNLAYTFDDLGNLDSRTDYRQGLSESFGYDNLNRLTTVTGPVGKSHSYDVLGNITMKSDFGDYHYDSSRPHAVTSVTDIATPTTVLASYSYDANGNMTSGDGRTISYTSFNKPSQIVKDGVTTDIVYDAGQNRLSKANSTTATFYVGKLYEKIVGATDTERKHYIIAGGSVVAMFNDRISGNDELFYMHKDHLGSVDVMTDENGTLALWQSYDAWGKRRNEDWTDATGPISTLSTRGFTGHEHDDEVGLINMNARLYDPKLARFITPDTIIPNSKNSQTYNRYTYVSNNPLSATDPSGHRSPKEAWDAYRENDQFKDQSNRWYNYTNPGYHVKRRQEMTLEKHPKAIPYVKAIYSAVITYYAGYFAAADFSRDFDYRMTMIMGGSSKDAFKASARGWATSLISSYASDAAAFADSWYQAAAIEGLAGGINAEIQGGDFEDGFAVGAGMSILNSMNRAARDNQIESSMHNPDNASGDSVGIDGDGFKLGGCRAPCKSSPLGGIQGKKGYLLFKSLEYDSGSFTDVLIESYAGPHDLLNSRFWYDSLGNGINRTGIMKIFGETLNAINILPATPLAISTLSRQYGVSSIVNQIVYDYHYRK